MKRLAARILVFLLIGAVINVAVAWGCRVRYTRMQSKRVLMHRSPVEWPTAVPAEWPSPQYESRWIALGYRRIVASAFVDDGVGVAERCAWIERSGWPLLSLEARRLWPPWHDTAVMSVSWGAGLHWPKGVWPDPGSGDLDLPLRAHWPGFAVNTLVFAGAAALLVSAGRVRRWYRVRQDLCPKCAYPVGAAPVCSECGGPVRERAGVAL